MRKLINTILLLASFSGFCQAQQNRDCGTPDPVQRLLVDTAFLAQQRPLNTFPLLMKVFVHVFANDNGTNLAASDTSIMRQLENMRQFYAPHGICFILAGMEQINNSDLNSHNADTEEADLTTYTVTGMLNIFIHEELFDNDGGLNGMAYDIPNFYFSVVGSAVTSSTNRSTTAHEVGHGFGLLHTFQAREDDDGNIIRENVPRTGICRNCELEGDLLCDTQADRNTDEANINQLTCTYTGGAQDECNITLLMEPKNIMTYGRRSCRDFFSAGQGGRAQYYILNTGFLTNAIAEDAITVNSDYNASAGRVFLLARNNVTINTSAYTVSGVARCNISSRAVTLRPGVTLAPTAGGYSVVRVNTICQ